MSATTWQTLRDAGIVDGDAPETSVGGSPWYVRAMLGVVGWVAALFLLGFVYAVVGGDLSSGSMLGVGLVLIAASAAILAGVERNEFALQLGLACAFAGQGLACFGLAGTLHALRFDELTGYLTIAAMEVALLFAVKHPVHRTWCALVAAACVWLAARAAGLPALATGLLAAGMACLWLVELDHPRAHAILAPAAYGVTFALLVAESNRVLVNWAPSMLGVRHVQAWQIPWLGEAFTALVFMGVTWRLCERPNLRLTPEQYGAAMLAGVLLAVVSRRAPGLASAVMIIVLGFGNGNRVLTGLGILTLLAAVFAYYYNLQTTLLLKAGLLAVTGAGLLVLRVAALHWMWPEAEGRRA